MQNSTHAFIDPLERWLRAIRQDDIEGALACLDELSREGGRLARHPDFRQRFAERRPGADPADGLAILCDYLRCATEGRELFLDNFVRRYAGEARTG